MSNLIIWYGLPGSGKSTQLKKFQAAGHQVFDDFMQNSIRNRGELPYSRHFVDIVVALRRGDSCAIADIRLCDSQYRNDVSRILLELVPELSIEWHCFDCRHPDSVEICRDNVRFREEMSGCDEEHALQYVDKMAEIFSIAEGAKVYPVTHARSANTK